VTSSATAPPVALLHVRVRVPAATSGHPRPYFLAGKGSCRPGTEWVVAPSEPSWDPVHRAM